MSTLDPSLQSMSDVEWAEKKEPSSVRAEQARYLAAHISYLQARCLHLARPSPETAAALDDARRRYDVEVVLAQWLDVHGVEVAQ